MTEHVILGIDPHGDDTHHITVATRDFGRANVVVPTASLNDPAFTTLLGIVTDLNAAIPTLSRRTAKQRRPTERKATNGQSTPDVGR